MALPILDGNQTAATLSTVLTSGEHIPAHTVVSLGSQAITDMRSAVSGSVVSISNFPSTQTIAGTVTANVLAGQYTTVSQGVVSIGSNSGVVAVSQYPNGALFSLEINTNNSTYKLQKSSATPQFGSPVDIEVTDIFSEAKTTEINTSGATKTYTFKKDHTFNEGYNRLLYVSGSGSIAQYKISTFSDAYWNQTIPVSISSVTIGSLPAISGTVTANNPSGALTTRFGSVTTANTAQITSAVTNTSRKYLLAQNISAGTVTIGIGFSPTTTQGVQLPAGGGLTFDAFCPTGAVYWLGAVTGAAFTILEG